MISKVKEEISAGKFVQSRIKKYFVENPNRTSVVVTPDPKFFEKKCDVLSKELRKQYQEMTYEQINNIYEINTSVNEYIGKTTYESLEFSDLNIGDIGDVLQNAPTFKQLSKRVFFNPIPQDLVKIAIVALVPDYLINYEMLPYISMIDEVSIAQESVLIEKASFIDHFGK